MGLNTLVLGNPSDYGAWFTTSSRKGRFFPMWLEIFWILGEGLSHLAKISKQSSLLLSCTLAKNVWKFWVSLLPSGTKHTEGRSLMEKVCAVTTCPCNMSSQVQIKPFQREGLSALLGNGDEVEIWLLQPSQGSLEDLQPRHETEVPLVTMKI